MNPAAMLLAVELSLPQPPPPPPAPPPARSFEESGAENRPMEGEITERLEAAVARGLAHLAAQQNPDGSFGRGRHSDNAGIVALAAVAFMADGHLPGRGRYGETVRRAIDFVLSQVSETGLIATEGGHGPMYGHGFATLMLGEAYGMAPDDARLRDALVRAVELIVNSQNSEGGWRYNPVPFDADSSVTICQVMALRSAREAGIKVPAATIERAIQYIVDCQNPDGGFKYMRTAGASGWARTAAGVATLFYAGVYEGESIDQGLGYLVRTAMPGGGSPSTQAHYYYGHYYAVQAMYLAGGEWWRRWWPAIREELLAQQVSSGAWLDPQQGNVYASAMALIVLQMPKRYLPIFQR
jgi:squalene cyclase